MKILFRYDFVLFLDSKEWVKKKLPLLRADSIGFEGGTGHVISNSKNRFTSVTENPKILNLLPGFLNVKESYFSRFKFYKFISRIMINRNECMVRIYLSSHIRDKKKIKKIVKRKGFFSQIRKSIWSQRCVWLRKPPNGVSKALELTENFFKGNFRPSPRRSVLIPVT